MFSRKQWVGLGTLFLGLLSWSAGATEPMDVLDIEAQGVQSGGLVSCDGQGFVLYRRPQLERETGELQPGRVEGIQTVTRDGATLRVTTSSGEVISSPWMNNGWARVAQKQLCGDRNAYLDLTECSFSEDSVLFRAQTCESKVESSASYLAAGPGLRELLKKLAPQGVNLKVVSLAYQCSRRWPIFGGYQVDGQVRILKTLDRDSPVFRSHFRLFQRGLAKQNAERRLHEDGVEVPGLSRILTEECFDPRANSFHP